MRVIPCVIIVWHVLLISAWSTLQVHGHRGSKGTHIENTLPAFEEACLGGADVLEFDLQLLADGVPVVFHDGYLTSRLCQHKNGTPIYDKIAMTKLTVSDLDLYDCGGKILTLAELLQWVSRKAFRIDLNMETKMNSRPKPDPWRFAQAVLKEVSQYGLKERTIVQSFDPRTLTAVRELDPLIRLAILTGRSVAYCREAKVLGVPIVSPNYHVVNEMSIRNCLKSGIAVIPYTVNEPEQWSRLRKLKVDGMITDYPRKLFQYLQ